MATSTAQADTLIRSGIAALQRGDAAGARAAFERAIAAGGAAPPWFLLAQACRHAGDDAAEEAALDQTLAIQPLNIGALIMRGDCHTRRGDQRSAAAFYRRAVKVAAGAPGQIPPVLAGELRRAEALAAEADRVFQDHVERRLAEGGFAGRAAGSRFAQAVDLLAGRSQPYFQQPTSFFYPGLPHIQFYEREDFPWMAEVEAATDATRAELLAVIEEEGAFRPYVENEPNRPPAGDGKLLGDPSWSAFHLYKQGLPHPENAARCPRTIEALGHAPLPFIRGRSPMALFSLLRPGAHIFAHNGLLNTRLICHLPLIVPPGCSLRVGNETREWRQGQVLIFDDSIEHEAWNTSAETRVILLFEIWRPELRADERAALTALFEAIEDFGGEGLGQEG
jgi:tetratricopeptide (TPR) repeat protein